MRVLVVEPRYGSVALSAYRILQHLSKNHQLGLITAFRTIDDESTWIDAKQWCQEVGSNLIDLAPIAAFTNDSTVPPSFYNDSESVGDLSFLKFLEHYDESYIELVFNQCTDLIKHAIELFQAEAIVSCFGLRHATHIVTSRLVGLLASDFAIPVSMYLDVPYFSRNYGRQAISYINEKYRDWVRIKFGAGLKKLALVHRCYPHLRDSLRVDKNIYLTFQETLMVKRHDLARYCLSYNRSYEVVR